MLPLAERSLINTSLSRTQIKQAYNSTTNTYPNPAWSERVDIPFGSSSYTPVQSLESIRYRGGEYMPVYSEQEYEVPLSNSVYMMVDTTLIMQWGAYYQVPYGFYLQEDDNVQSIYYICSDANYPEIKYYYIPNVFMDIAQTLTEVDPFEAYQFVYSYPCSGTPESSMTITSGIPLQSRPNSLPTFAVPSYLGFSPVSGVVGSSDLDTINIHSSKVYERVALVEEESSSSNSKSVERAFYYDYLGRVIQTVEKNHLGGISRTSSKYDFLGNLLSLNESHQSSSTASADIKLTNYSYDTSSRLLSETTSVNSQVSVTVSYSYDNLGKLITKTYGNGLEENLTYNIQGWLKSKNTAKSGANIFNMTLRYYDPLYVSSLYSGNISEMQWQHAAGANNAYAFSYDKLGRLVNTGRYLNGTPQSSFTEKDIAYDNNGNIKLLKRYGSIATSPQDSLKYNYNGNTLTSISGTINASYSHDGNGNITVDGRKNLQIEYNLFNLPQTVKQETVSKALYSWLSDGTKASVVEDTLSNTGYSYLGSMVYSIAQGVHTLESVSFSSGQIIHTTGTYSPYYHTTDHLGSIRAITNSTGAIAEQNDYYPFGQRTNLGQNYSLLSANRYKYNGKEEQATGNLQYLDYGARFYDPTIARWLSVDPLADVAPGWSPYRAFYDNPIRYIDPTGMLEDDYGLDKDGNIALLRETDDKTDKLIALDNKGQETDKSVEVEKGVLNNVKTDKDSRGTSYDYMKVGNNETATKLFEFVAENSQVEWSQVKYGTKSNYISTSHNPASESGGVDLMYNLLTTGYTVRENIHSHPNRKSSYHGPSGFHPRDKNSGDRELGEWLNKYYPSKGIKLKVYEVPLKKYIQYNHKEIVK